MSVFQAFVLFGVSAVAGLSAHGAAFSLERTIALPKVTGRIDHCALDAAGSRLFVAALGNDTVEVVDLKAGKVSHSIAGFSEPQGIFFVAEMNRLYVANGGDGAVQVFDGTTFAAMAPVKLSGDADNVRYDAATGKIYVGFGHGGITSVDSRTATVGTPIQLASHPESFQLETLGDRVFVNLPGAREIAVFDRRTGTILNRWKLDGVGGNFAMALDELHRRLFIACRSPARLVVLDIASGQEVARLPLHGDCDDLFFDSNRNRLYASCGEGFVDIFSRTDANQYAREETLPTLAGARTCFFDGRKLYLALPARRGREAEIRVYEAR